MQTIHDYLTAAREQLATSEAQGDDVHAAYVAGQIAAYEMVLYLQAQEAEAQADADASVEDLLDQRRRAAERLAAWPRPEDSNAG